PVDRRGVRLPRVEPRRGRRGPGRDRGRRRLPARGPVRAVRTADRRRGRRDPGRGARPVSARGHAALTAAGVAVIGVTLHLLGDGVLAGPPLLDPGALADW